MGTRNKQIDTYIAKSAEFAQPILHHLRQLVHKACPDAEEKMKWSFPHFDYKGMMCSMAAFKEHCAFGFWKASLMTDPRKILGRMGQSAMGDFGRITSLKELPSDQIILLYIKEAAKLNEDGVNLPPRVKNKGNKLDIPDYFMRAIRKNKKALSTFESFTYSNKKEYVQWIAEAKTEETRSKRLATAIGWMAQGKVWTDPTKLDS